MTTRRLLQSTVMVLVLAGCAKSTTGVEADPIKPGIGANHVSSSSADGDTANTSPIPASGEAGTLSNPAGGEERGGGAMGSGG